MYDLHTIDCVQRASKLSHHQTSRRSTILVGEVDNEEEEDGDGDGDGEEDGQSS